MAHRRLIRVDPAPMGTLAGVPAVWFREGDASERHQRVSSFLNWLRLPGALLILEPAPDPDALPMED